MIVIALVSIALVALTTLVHYEVLRLLTIGLPQLRVPRRTKLIAVIFASFFAHTAEITLYGLALFLLIHCYNVGTLSGSGGSSLMNCLYFSAETYTSLGFGDMVPLGPVRLVAGVETLNGLLLIAWSASYTYIAMERFWNEGSHD